MIPPGIGAAIQQLLLDDGFRQALSRSPELALSESRPPLNLPPNTCLAELPLTSGRRPSPETVVGVCAGGERYAKARVA